MSLQQVALAHDQPAVHPAELQRKMLDTPALRPAPAGEGAAAVWELQPQVARTLGASPAARSPPSGDPGRTIPDGACPPPGRHGGGACPHLAPP